MSTAYVILKDIIGGSVALRTSNGRSGAKTDELLRALTPWLRSPLDIDRPSVYVAEMNVAILGTGMVGRTIAARLSELGHNIAVGTRDPAATLARTETDSMGTPPFAQWQSEYKDVALKSYSEVAQGADLIVNATSGSSSLDALHAVGSAGLDGKVLLDIANPLDFSAGFPPTLFVSNTDSLGEQIQRAFPRARVVKSLNTMYCGVMVDPNHLSGEHDVFVAGNDAAAKTTVRGLLREFGWKDANILDLGGLRAARGTEMFLPLWLSLMQANGTGDFNVRIVRA
jgi:8-hydroxy-5-deazaflavin:NADPH oxidoreductase